MKAIFVDTSYWIALLHETDDLHNRAQALDKKLTNVQLITSESASHPYFSCNSPIQCFGILVIDLAINQSCHEPYLAA